MKPRFPLSSRILLLAAVNVVLLFALLAAFIQFELGMNLNEVLFAPAQDRALSVGREVAVELDGIGIVGRDALLARFKQNYGAEFYLFLDEGAQLAGPSVTLPAEVSEELIRQPPPGRGSEFGRPPPDEKGPPPGSPRPLRSEKKFGRDGKLRDGKDRDGKDRDGKDRGPGQTQRGGIFQKSAGGLYWVGVRIPIPDEAGTGALRGTVIMTARSFYGTPLFFNFLPWFAAVGAAIAICAACWLPFIRGVTRTVTQVTQATQQIAEGHFEHHLPEQRSDELGLLAASINRMATRLSGFVTGQKRFLGDIAHELCAPLARIEFGMGILEHKTPAAERESVADVQEEVRHMSGLVAELLSFSKAGMASADRPLVPVDVALLVQDAVTREAAGDRVRVQVEHGVAAMADPAMLVRSLGNLVRNALRYAGDAGPILISAEYRSSNSRHDRVLIRVSDSGPGLPEEELERIFTPFYRPEKSRNRESGGVGLGLAIVKSCVEACQGTVSCRNRVPSGLVVEIELAAAPG